MGGHRIQFVPDSGWSCHVQIFLWLWSDHPIRVVVSWNKNRFVRLDGHTLLGTNISHQQGDYEDDFPFPMVGYLRIPGYRVSHFIHFSLPKPLIKFGRNLRFYHGKEGIWCIHIYYYIYIYTYMHVYYTYSQVKFCWFDWKSSIYTCLLFRLVRYLPSAVGSSSDVRLYQRNLKYSRLGTERRLGSACHRSLWTHGVTF